VSTKGEKKDLTASSKKIMVRFSCKPALKIFFLEKGKSHWTKLLDLSLFTFFKLKKQTCRSCCRITIHQNKRVEKAKIPIKTQKDVNKTVHALSSIDHIDWRRLRHCFR
jgi:hypothetical protein